MAFDFEAALLEDSKPDLGEASEFYLRLVKSAAAIDPPDETGALEGQFAVPVVQVLRLLSGLVRNEFETIYAYTVYAETLRDFAHDAISEHFQEHAEEELEHATFLLKRMAVLGGSVNVPDIAAPHASTDPVDIIKTMCRMEQEGIEGWRKLLTIVGENPMRIKAEEYMVAEQQHLDELCQLLPRETAIAPVAKVASAEERAKGQASAYAGLSRKFEIDRHTKGERGGDLVGRIAGAVLGGATHKLHHNPLASVGAAFLGQHIGGRVGGELGSGLDAARFEKKSFVFDEGTGTPTGDAADSFVQHLIGEGQYDRTDRVPEARLAWESQGTKTLQKKLAYALKLAAGEMAGNNASAVLAGAGGERGTTTAGAEGEELGSTQEGVAAAPPPHAGQGSLLSNKMLESFLGADRAGHMAELQQQAEYYKQLSQQAQQTADSTAQQLQQVQEQATELQQQVQMSQQQVEQSMQQAQQIQAQAMATAESAQQIAAQSAQGHLQAMQETALHKQLSENMRAGVLQLKSNIQSVLSQDPTEGAEMRLAGNNAPGVQGPAVGGDVATGGSAGNAPAQEVAPEQAPQTGNVPTEQGSGKTAGVKIDMIKQELLKRAPYMAVGGALGAGAAVFGRPHSKQTRLDVQEAERKGGGPIRDLNTAKHKIRHAMAEYVDQHPVAGSALLGVAAANAAGAAGPAIRTVVTDYLKHRKGVK